MIQYLKELEEPHTVREFSSYDTFKELYYVLDRTPSRSTDDISSEDATEPVDAKVDEVEDEDDGALKKLSNIDLIIFRNDGIRDTPAWAMELEKNLKTYNLWPEEGFTKLVATKYEDDGTVKGKLVSPLINDLICLPIDRLIFLQKMEIVLALPKQISPSFLFTQKVDAEIEISKKTKIVKLSDLGFVVDNAVPLTNGVGSHFYFRFPGHEETIEVYAKSIASKPNPDTKGRYWVYFMFFGIHRHALTMIRKYLAEDRFFKPLKNQNAEDFEFNPDNLFISDEDRRPRNIAIIEVEERTAESISQSILKEIGPVQVFVEDSYYMFLKRYLNPKRASADFESANELMQAEDIYSDILSWTINKDTRELITLLTPPDSKEKKSDTEPVDTPTVCGHAVEDLFNSSRGWMELFANSEAETLLEEIFKTLSVNKKSARNIGLQYADKSARIGQVEISELEDHESLQINIKLPNQAEIEAYSTYHEATSIDMIVVNHVFLPENVDSWIDNVNELAGKAGLLPPSGKIKVVVIAQEAESFPVRRYIDSKAYGLLFKPVVNSRLLFHISTALNASFTLYNFTNIGWKETSIVAYAAKPVQLESLSEYGATIKHPRPFSDGTFLYLHGSIFEKAPDQNLCARAYKSQKDENSKNSYHCSFLYFGINESFLKYTRSWIRELYASSKE
ncbi:MAG: hypothetical protein H6626_05005 [Pseudobdellovibrionaceae bacterium]|nr:MAG: hypothetical protein H6626_05005 [Pseudobdellovibrionaceae bacterium]